ncbi:hypothetical protein [Desulfomonile tiedjei]|uniref:Uncharacterized protein n=1 Tax=Desulfomonile tiedjei (strain ATCC 49306 / DSM 6799 / DCB-1) TaxID=706587 RepID=I4C904_DESTA|nr:hypothetical protein [Desulfomonile tiedjei]AFM26045.1 hypothetical protein Desti_3390 [Desulfomonile tiedjei DSM 6799]
MAKTFFSKRSVAGMAVMMDTIDHARKDLQRAEKQYGQAAKETVEPVQVSGIGAAGALNWWRRTAVPSRTNRSWSSR